MRGVGASSRRYTPTALSCQRTLARPRAPLHNDRVPDPRAIALQIAAVTGLDPRSVLAVFDGRPVRRSTRTAVEVAAKKLRFELPATGDSK